MVNVWLPPRPTATAPVGVMVPPVPAEAVMVNCGPMTRVLEFDVAVICGKAGSAT